ncbi:ABC transporter permease [Psychrobacillus sp. INOP01]|uniref:ABC transporter permease n=1 Tax=Psychrobacillus sp. INOP01 TaxID=2829187 RepID=UPI001BA4B3F8|nr:ABC transporter permease [Psychrobacillus sp. INOP01]QUG43118.1 ABC transporter permease [Psychrobacillus sp. INOP01]
MLFKLALKIIKFRKKSYLFTIIGIGFGVGLLISSNFLFSQLEKSTEIEIIDKYGEADLRIGYRQGKLLTAKEAEIVSNGNYFVSTSQVITNPQQFSSSFDSAQHNKYFIAVDNHYLSKQIYNYNTSIDLDEVILTQRLATNLNAKLGEVVTIPLNDQRSLKKKVKEVIPNIEDSSAPDIILFNIDSVKDEMGIVGASNLIFAKLNPEVDAQEAITYLRNNIDQDLVIDVVAEFDEVKKNVYNMKLLTVGLGVLIVILSGLLFLNNFQLALRSRDKEIATMRMIGANKKHILKLIMSEALIINSIGVFLGVLLSIVFSLGFKPLLESNFNLAINPFNFNLGILILICFTCWLFITVLSFVPALQAIKISPLQAYRKSNYSRINPKKWKKVLFILFIVTGTLFLIIESVLAGINAESRTSLLGLVGSLIFAMGLLMCITYIIPSIIRFFQPVLVMLGGNESIISLKNFKAERNQNTKVIQIMAISISLSILIPSVLQLLKSEMEQNAAKIYTTDIVASSNKFINSTLPEGIMEEVYGIQGIKRAIPISTLNNLLLYNFDFSMGEQEWLKGKNELIYAKQKITEKEILPFVYTDISALQQQGIIDEESEYTVNSIIFTKKTAKHLGVKVGDIITLGNPPFTNGHGIMGEVKVASVIPYIPGDGAEEGVIIDRNNPIIEERDISIRSILIDTEENMKPIIFEKLESMNNEYPELYWSSLEEELSSIDKQINERFMLLWIILSITIIIALFGVMNALNANIQSNRREYAILRAISLEPSQISKVIYINSFIFNLIGIIFGIVMGIVLTYGISLSLNTSFYVSFNSAWIVIILMFVLTQIISIPISTFIRKKSILSELHNE